MNQQNKTETSIMKVTIQNLGIIKNAELDLKPLTVLIGPNNAGKTWMAYTLAGIFGSHGLGAYTEAYIKGETNQIFSSVEQAIEQVVTHGKATVNLVEFAELFG